MPKLIKRLDLEFTEYSKSVPTMHCQHRPYFSLNSRFIYLATSWKKGNVSTFGSSEPTYQPTNKAHNFSVLTYLFIFVLFQCVFCTIHSILLHFLRHVSFYDNGFASKHLGWPATIGTTQSLTLTQIITPYQKLLFSFMQNWQLNHIITVCNSSQLPTSYKSITNLTRLPLLTQSVADTTTSI